MEGGRSERYTGVTMNVEQTIRDYLAQVLHMSLATSSENRTWVCEVHFACDDDLNLYFRSLSSRRHSQEIAVNPQVAGNIVRQHGLGELVRGVYFEGEARKLEAGAECDMAYKCLSERLGLDEKVLAEADRPDGHQFYEINMHTFYLFDAVETKPSQKFELSWSK